MGIGEKKKKEWAFELVCKVLFWCLQVPSEQYQLAWWWAHTVFATEGVPYERTCSKHLKCFRHRSFRRPCLGKASPAKGTAPPPSHCLVSGLLFHLLSTGPPPPLWVRPCLLNILAGPGRACWQIFLHATPRHLCQPQQGTWQCFQWSSPTKGDGKEPVIMLWCFARCFSFIESLWGKGLHLFFAMVILKQGHWDRKRFRNVPEVTSPVSAGTWMLI